MSAEEQQQRLAEVIRKRAVLELAGMDAIEVKADRARIALTS